MHVPFPRNQSQDIMDWLCLPAHVLSGPIVTAMTDVT
jgi:hypothetical protein